MCAIPAQALTFTIETSDLRPIGDVTYFVYGTGPIAEGDTERLLGALRSKNRLSDQRVYISLHSPGGSVVEGIKIGRAISKLGADTDVARQTSRRLSSLPGECMSACVLAYLGGNYRYLKKDSKLGIHRFAFSKERTVEAGVAVAVTQVLSAEIVKFIKESRADTDFFALMTNVSADEIFLVPHEKLREMRVVTDNIWDEEWSFEFADGIAYLKIWQQSYHGENKLILYCNSRKLVGMVFVETDTFGFVPDTVGIFIDGTLETIPTTLMLQQPKVQQKVANAAFIITPELSRRMLAANSIGAAMQPPNKNIYLGFKSDRKKDREKLSKMILGCR